MLQMTSDHLAALLARATSFLETFEDADGREAQALLRDARLSLAPLHFTPRLEPRTVVQAALRSLAARPRLLHSAVQRLFDEALLTRSSQISLLLELLARSNSPDGELIAFDLVERNEILASRGWERDTVHEALVCLASAGGVLAITSLITRLRQTGGVAGPGALTAVRMTATLQPSFLGLLLRDLRDDLEALGSERLGVLVNDITHRAGPHTVLASLVQLSMSDHAQLIRAAFAPPTRCFRIVRSLDMLTGRDETMVECILADLPYAIPTAALNSDAYWHRTVAQLANIGAEAAGSAGRDSMATRQNHDSAIDLEAARMRLRPPIASVR
jgi:hypothetical protein